MVEDYKQMQGITIDFFKKLFTAPSSSSVPRQHGLGKTLTDAQSDSLTHPASMTEIKEAMFSFKSDSGPWSDGYTAEFFKANYALM